MANEKKTEQTFSFEVVSCLLAAMLENGVVLGNKHFTMMSQLAPPRTASGYEHMFRAAKARAKEISARSGADGGVATPTAKKSKAATAATPKTGGNSDKKRARKARSEQMGHEVDEDDDQSPSKRMKSQSDGEVKGEAASKVKAEGDFLID